MKLLKFEYLKPRCHLKCNKGHERDNYNKNKKQLRRKNIFFLKDTAILMEAKKMEDLKVQRFCGHGLIDKVRKNVAEEGSFHRGNKRFSSRKLPM